MVFGIYVRLYKTTGIIIKRINFSEADRILTVFTKEYGKIKVLAKGVRKITSKRGGNVELLNLAQIALHKGKNFDLLTEAQVINSFPDLRTNLKKIGLSYLLCEIVDGLCPEHQENQKIYEELIKVLSLLNEQSIKQDTQITNNFKLFLLHTLGFWPQDKDLPLDKIDQILEEILEKKIKSNNFLTKIT